MGSRQAIRPPFILLVKFVCRFLACTLALAGLINDMVMFSSCPSPPPASFVKVIGKFAHEDLPVGVDIALLMRPYSPAFFRQGAALGPQFLLLRQQGKIKNEAALRDAWKK